ncbi:hypothetical protein [Xanthomonas translucens]|uniref:hypothetical protein n=1 Tax=Xanthomonas campestris pv. translucens TaxID=343 RepID=UPI00216547FC|nr:hypothetical protein [Xanthomonas translucens]
MDPPLSTLLQIFKILAKFGDIGGVQRIGIDIVAGAIHQANQQVRMPVGWVE